MKMLGARLQYHFAKCAAASIAIGMIGEHARAAVVYSGPVNLAIPTTANGLYLNVVTGQYNADGGTGATVPGWTINPWGATGLNFFVATSSASSQHILRVGGGGIANLNYADIIGRQEIYGGWSSTSAGAFTTGNQFFNLNSPQNFYGFRFLLEGQMHYGWARIELGNSLTAPRRILEYAWEDSPNAPIFFFLEAYGACCYGATCTVTYDIAGCAQSGGVWQGAFTTCTNNPCLPGCQADIAGPDGIVNVADLLAVINQWGSCPLPPASCPADVNHDNRVAVSDLLFVINSWGACP